MTVFNRWVVVVVGFAVAVFFDVPSVQCLLPSAVLWRIRVPVPPVNSPSKFRLPTCKLLITKNLVLFVTLTAVGSIELVLGDLELSHTIRHVNGSLVRPLLLVQRVPLPFGIFKNPCQLAEMVDLVAGQRLSKSLSCAHACISISLPVQVGDGGTARATAAMEFAAVLIDGDEFASGGT